MAILQTCCCWSNVRTGSIACGVYTIVLAILNGAIVAYNLHSHEDLQKAFNDGFNATEAIALHKHHHVDSAKAWFLPTLGVCVLLFGTAILLIVGIHREKRFLLIPWVITVSVLVLLDTACLIYQITNLGMLTLFIIQMGLWLAQTVLNIYCILCVISQYQELKAGRGTAAYILEQRLRVLYASHPAVQPIQQVHISQGPIVFAGGNAFLTTTTIHNARNPSGDSTTSTSRPPAYHSANMSPPDYNIAASQLPQYQESSENAQEDPLLLENERKRHRSSPPPYRP